MSQFALFGLVATLPLAVLGFGLGWVGDRAGLHPAARARLWRFVLFAPLWLAAAALTGAPMVAARPPPPPRLAPVAAPALSPEAAPPLQLTEPVPAPAPQTPPADYAVWLLAAVAAGAAVQGAIRLGKGRAARRLARQAEACRDPALLRLLAERAASLGLAAPPLKLWNGAEAALVGALSPVLLLPARLAREGNPQKIGPVLTHELAHLKAGDARRAPLIDLVCALLWFNPATAACAERMRAAQEEACDAVALARADRAVRRAYAETLVAAFKLRAAPQAALAFTGARGKPAALRRLRAILRPRPAAPGRAWAVAALAGLGCLGGLGLTTLAFAAAQPSKPAPTVTPTAAKPGQPSPAAATSTTAPTRVASKASPATAPSSSPFQAVLAAQLRASEAEVTAAQAQVKQASLAQQTAQSQYNVGLITSDQFAQAKTAMAQAEAGLRKAQAEYEGAAEYERVVALVSAPSFKGASTIIHCQVDTTGAVYNCGLGDGGGLLKALSDAKAAADAAKRQLNLISGPNVTDPAVVAELSQDKTLQNIEAQLDQQRDTYAADSPNLVNLTKQAERRVSVLQQAAMSRFDEAQMELDSAQTKLDYMMRAATP